MNMKADIVAVRTAIKANPRLELELKGRISETLRAFGVAISGETFSELVFATENELSSVTFGPLPTPSLPPVISPAPDALGPLPAPSLPPLAETRGPLPTPSLPPVIEP